MKLYVSKPFVLENICQITKIDCHKYVTGGLLLENDSIDPCHKYVTYPLQALR